MNSTCPECLAAEKYRPKCGFCGKLGHLESKSWKKNLHLNPHKNKPEVRPRPALIAYQEDYDRLVRLMAKYHNSAEPVNNGN